MSSMATHHVWPANDTVSARRAARSPRASRRRRPAVDRAADLGLGQRPEQPQQIRDALGVAGEPVGGEVLQLGDRRRR